jgi:TRAP-type C4-dicarboxylate transport system permease small subunit
VKAVFVGLVRNLDRVLTGVSHTAYVISAAAVLLMALLTAVGVFTRQLLGVVVLDTPVIGELSVAVLTFLGLAWTFRLGRHVSAELVVVRLPRSWALVVDAVGLSVVLVALMISTILTGRYAYSALLFDEQILGIMRVSSFPFKALMPLGLGLLSLQVFRQIVLDLMALKDPSRAMPLQGTTAFE